MPEPGHMSSALGVHRTSCRRYDESALTRALEDVITFGDHAATIEALVDAEMTPLMPMGKTMSGWVHIYDPEAERCRDVAALFADAIDYVAELATQPAPLSAEDVSSSTELGDFSGRHAEAIEQRLVDRCSETRCLVEPKGAIFDP